MSYDLSNFLERFAARERTWILSLYEEALSRLGHRLPARPILASLFDTAESARLASRVIWPAMALANGDGEWGYESLATFDQWFEDYRPVLSTEVGQEAVV